MPPRQRRAPRRNDEEGYENRCGGDAPPPPPLPPPMPDVGQLVAALLAALPRLGEPEAFVGCSLADFFEHNSPVFDGSGGPIVAKDWVTSFDDLADALSCTDEQKAKYAGLKLIGEANYWWKSAKALIAEELGLNVPITWERFKREFNDRFFPRAQRQQCARDFQDLKQGNMLVEQYSAEFLKLSRYAPRLIPDEETKIERFRDGLSPQILEKIIFLKVTDYVDMVHTATMAEKGILEAIAYYNNRKQSLSLGAPSSPSPPPPKKQSFSSRSGSIGGQSALVSQNSVGVTSCGRCGKMHLDVCRWGTSRTCFKCGRVGHCAKNCQQVTARIQASKARNNQPRPMAPAKVYNMLAQENAKANGNAANVANVAIGTIPLFHSIACIWLDLTVLHHYLICICMIMHDEHRTLRTNTHV
jgi:hypothetical protein